jgi:mannose-6-phosphate isomerase-like protein (cupin superfamily)
MKETIKPLRLGDEYYTSEGCYITELSNSSEDPDVSIARARVEPGITTCWHRLVGTVERYVILQGKARVDVGNLQSKEISAGDIVLIPAMCRQRISNIGADDLVFLAICSPRFRNDVYEDIEGDLTSS